MKTMRSNIIASLLLGFMLFAACGCNNQKSEFYDKAFTKVPAPSDVIMYEANQRIFAESGSLKAITARLDEIKALNTNVLWLMPLSEQGKLNSVGSPYCVKDYKKVEPEYGTLDDLRELVKEAHKRDMAVIIDWVANHTSWDSNWMEHKDWYTQDSLGNIVAPIEDWKDVADLNFDNQEMQAAMIDAMKFWIKEANIDGFRCDAADFVPLDFWEKAIKELRAMEEGRTILMLAEGNLQDYFSAGFDLDYAWAFYDEMKKLYNGDATIADLYRVNQEEYAQIPAGKEKLRFSTNHDKAAWEASPIMEFKGERGAMTAFVFATTMGGVPLIYSSQEVGASEFVPFFHYYKFDWNQNPAILNEYKKIMDTYATTEALKNGTLKTFDNENVACYSLSNDTQQVLIAVNFKDAQETLQVPQEFVGAEFVNKMFNTDMTLAETIDMEPYQYYILLKK